MDKKFEDEFDDGLDGVLDDIDFGEESFDAKPVNKDRGVVLNTLNNVSTGFVEATIDADKKDLALNLVKGVIPKSIKNDTENLVDVASDLKDEIKNSGSQIRSQGRNLLRQVDRYLPKGGTLSDISNKLKGWLGPDSSSNYSDNANVNLYKDKVDKLLGKQDEKARYEDLLKQQIQHKKDLSQLQLLQNISSNVELTTRFNDQITNAYMRKSLELQYKHLFVAKEQLEVTKRGYDGFKLQFEALVKNTGLPDMLKTRSPEVIAFMAKRKIYGDIGNKLYSIDGWGKALKKKSISKTKSIGMGILDALNTGTDMIDSGASAREMLIEAGVNPQEIMGSNIAEMLQNLGTDKVSKLLSKTKKGSQLEFAVKKFSLNPQRFLEEYGYKNSNWLGKLAYNSSSLFADDVESNSLNDMLRDPDQATQFDNRAHRSIVTVIPTLLSKILKEVSSIAGHNSGELTYDYTSDTFIDKKDVKSRFETILKSNIVNSGTTRGAVDVVDFLIKYGNVQFSSSEIKDVVRGFSIYVTTRRNIDILDITTKKVMALFPKKVRGRVKKALTVSLYKSPDKMENMTRLTDLLYRLKRSIPDPVSLIEEFYRSGNIEELKNSGIVKYDSDTGQYSLDSDQFGYRFGSLTKDTLDKDYLSKFNTEKKDELRNTVKDKLIGIFNRDYKKDTTDLFDNIKSNIENVSIDKLKTKVKNIPTATSKIKDSETYIKSVDKLSDAYEETTDKINDIIDSNEYTKQEKEKLLKELNSLKDDITKKTESIGKESSNIINKIKESDIVKKSLDKKKSLFNKQETVSVLEKLKTLDTELKNRSIAEMLNNPEITGFIDENKNKLFTSSELKAFKKIKDTEIVDKKSILFLTKVRDIINGYTISNIGSGNNSLSSKTSSVMRNIYFAKKLGLDTKTIDFLKNNNIKTNIPQIDMLLETSQTVIKNKDNIKNIKNNMLGKLDNLKELDNLNSIKDKLKDNRFRKHIEENKNKIFTPDEKKEYNQLLSDPDLKKEYNSLQNSKEVFTNSINKEEDKPLTPDDKERLQRDKFKNKSLTGKMLTGSIFDFLPFLPQPKMLKGHRGISLAARSALWLGTLGLPSVYNVGKSAVQWTGKKLGSWVGKKFGLSQEESKETEGKATIFANTFKRKLYSKKKNEFDTDGDGRREGSWLDRINVFKRTGSKELSEDKKSGLLKKAGVGIGTTALILTLGTLFNKYLGDESKIAKTKEVLLKFKDGALTFFNKQYNFLKDKITNIDKYASKIKDISIDTYTKGKEIYDNISSKIDNVSKFVGGYYEQSKKFFGPVLTGIEKLVGNLDPETLGKTLAMVMEGVLAWKFGKGMIKMGSNMFGDDGYYPDIDLPDKKKKRTPRRGRRDKFSRFTKRTKSKFGNIGKTLKNMDLTKKFNKVTPEVLKKMNISSKVVNLVKNSKGKIAVKVGAKLGLRMIPGLGLVLFAYDAVGIAKNLWDGQDIGSAISNYYLGTDITEDETDTNQPRIDLKDKKENKFSFKPLPTVDDKNRFKSNTTMHNYNIDNSNQALNNLTYASSNKYKTYGTGIRLKEFKRVKVTPKEIDNFRIVERNATVANNIANINKHFVMAQQILENGWTGKILKGTNNYFNIKADKRWKGKSKKFKVHEFDSNKRKYYVHDGFRVYDTPDESATDYAYFLMRNRRYKRVLQLGNGSVEDTAYAMQEAGYATDPNYASKIIAIAYSNKFYTLLDEIGGESSGNIDSVKTLKGFLKKIDDSDNSENNKSSSNDPENKVIDTMIDVIKTKAVEAAMDGADSKTKDNIDKGIKDISVTTKPKPVSNVSTALTNLTNSNTELSTKYINVVKDQVRISDKSLQTLNRIGNVLTESLSVQKAMYNSLKDIQDTSIKILEKEPLTVDSGKSKNRPLPDSKIDIKRKTF